MIEHLIAGLKALWLLSEAAVRVLLVASVMTNFIFAWSLNRRVSDGELERARWDEQRKAELLLLSEVRQDVRHAVETIITVSARIAAEDRKR